MNYGLRGPSGRIWTVDATRSDGHENTDADALHVYADLASGDIDAWQLVERVDGAWVDADWPAEWWTAAR